MAIAENTAVRISTAVGLLASACAAADQQVGQRLARARS